MRTEKSPEHGGAVPAPLPSWIASGPYHPEGTTGTHEWQEAGEEAPSFSDESFGPSEGAASLVASAGAPVSRSAAVSAFASDELVSASAPGARRGTPSTGASPVELASSARSVGSWKSSKTAHAGVSTSMAASPAQRVTRARDLGAGRCTVGRIALTTKMNGPDGHSR